MYVLCVGGVALVYLAGITPGLIIKATAPLWFKKFDIIKIYYRR
jgi:hypothetical protein